MSPPARRRRVRRFPSGAAVAAALVIAACTPTPPDPYTPYPDTAAARRAPAANTQAKAEPEPGPSGSQPMQQAPAQQAKAVALPAEPEPEPEPLPEPGELSGLGAGAVRDRLGEPVFTRSDPPAALWQYRRDGCVLDLYLFGTDTRLSVRHFEFRPDPREDRESGAESGAPLDARKCYAALIRAEDMRAGR